MRREAVDRDDHRRAVAAAQLGDPARDRAVVGDEGVGEAPADRGRRQLAVARNLGAVAERRDRGRIARQTVGIDDQARDVAQHGRRIEQAREPARHIGRADVERDVALELLRGQAEIAKPAGDPVPGMVADQKQRRRAGGIGKSRRPAHRPPRQRPPKQAAPARQAG